MRVLPLALLAALSTSAYSDMLGVYVGYGNWNPDFSGRFQNGTTGIVIGKDTGDLDIKDKKQTDFYVA